jgi:hypothetical protein
MNLHFSRSCIFFLSLASFLLPIPVGAQDRRTSPIDAFILLDATPAMDPVRREALDWLISTVVDGIIQDGDRIALVSVSKRPVEPIFRTISSGKDIESLKAAIQGMETASGPADYAAALGMAAETEKARSDRNRIFFTLLVGVYVEEMDANQGKVSYNGIDLLKYSRVKDFPGWKAIVVGLGLDDAVQKAAAVYTDAPAADSSDAQGR